MNTLLGEEEVMDKHRLIRSKIVIYKLGKEASTGSKTVESLTLNLFSSDFRESKTKHRSLALWCALAAAITN